MEGVFQVLEFIAGFAIYGIANIKLIQIFLDYKDIVDTKIRVLQLLFIQSLIIFCLYLQKNNTTNNMDIYIASILFVLYIIGVIIALLSSIFNFFNDKSLSTISQRLKVFLCIAFYSIFNYTIIYFYIMMTDNKSFTVIEDSYFGRLVDAFYLSVTNYFNAGDHNLSPTSIISKLMVSFQKIYSFLTLVVGITFFINNEQTENDNHKKKCKERKIKEEHCSKNKKKK